MSHQPTAGNTDQVAREARYEQLVVTGETISHWYQSPFSNSLHDRYANFPCLCSRVHRIKYEMHDFIQCYKCGRHYDIDWKLNEDYEMQCIIRLIRPIH